MRHSSTFRPPITTSVFALVRPFSTCRPTGCSLLHEKIGQTRIAIVLRRQDKFANSYMNQLVKAQRVSFEAICQFEDTITDYDLHFDYQATLNQMGEISGEVDYIFDSLGLEDDLCDSLRLAQLLVRCNIHLCSPLPDHQRS